MNLSGSCSVDLDVEDVDVREPLEQDSLALHDRLAGGGADVAEAEDGRPVRDDADEVALAGVLVDELGVPGDLEARLGDAGRVGERKVAGGRARLGGDDLEFSLAARRVVVEGVLFGEAHAWFPFFLNRAVNHSPRFTRLRMMRAHQRPI